MAPQGLPIVLDLESSARPTATPGRTGALELVREPIQVADTRARSHLAGELPRIFQRRSDFCDAHPDADEICENHSRSDPTIRRLSQCSGSIVVFGFNVRRFLKRGKEFFTGATGGPLP
jgi:hypothetical protein